MKSFNKFNQFYVDEFNVFLKEAKDKNNKNLTTIYKKLITSIQKYPLPIITATQALCLEGVGEKNSKTFENLINKYKQRIKQDDIDYLSLVQQLDYSFDLKDRKKMEKSKSKEKSNFDSSKRKKLPNIEQTSSLWSSIISCYANYIQNDYNKTIEYDDITAMADTLQEQLSKVL